MSRRPKPLSLVMFQDVLCATCHVAERRLELVRREFGEQLSWRTRPFPLRVHDTPLTTEELDEWIQHVELAKKEPEGAALTADLWTSGDAPRSSLPALAAIEAARLQGAQAHAAMAQAVRRAALELGVNVARADALFELADTVGLDMNRFSVAFQSPQTRRLILSGQRQAKARGVRAAPALVIGGRWMVCGLREVAEYREYLVSCLHQVERARIGSASDAIH